MYGTHKCVYIIEIDKAELIDVYSVDTFVMWPVIPYHRELGELKMGLILCQLYACLFRYIVYALRKHFHVAHLVLLRLTLFLF